MSILLLGLFAIDESGGEIVLAAYFSGLDANHGR
jgi:hypothetical protein